MLGNPQEHRLYDTITAAIALADEQQRYLVGALLSEALDALKRDQQASRN